MLNALHCEIGPGLRTRSGFQGGERNVSTNKGEGAMDLQGLLILLIVGAIAGWLAGVIMRGFGFGLIGNIIVGIVGAVIAGWLLPQLGIFIGSGIVGSIINALIGAVILLFIIGLVRR
jgi:uncharacterized membrane protein YeaQ/YmgE (transglycosylase-associated protein family)